MKKIFLYNMLLLLVFILSCASTSEADTQYSRILKNKKPELYNKIIEKPIFVLTPKEIKNRNYGDINFIIIFKDNSTVEFYSSEGEKFDTLNFTHIEQYPDFFNTKNLKWSHSIKHDAVINDNNQMVFYLNNDKYSETMTFNFNTQTGDSLYFMSENIHMINIGRNYWNFVLDKEIDLRQKVPKAVSEDDFGIIQTNTGKIKITYYDGEERNLIIPSRIKGITVVSIGRYAFSHKGLTSIIIPASITEIEDFAFFDNRLTNIIIPLSVTKIGEQAFSDNSLINIDIPKNATQIGKHAFSGNKLTSIKLSNFMTKIDGYIFSANYKFTTSITIGPNVTVDSSGLDESFINYYKSKNKRAGTYIKEGSIWKLQ